MYDEAKTEIQQRIEAFYHGEPQSFEVEVADGVFFSMDCPHEEDLLEPMIPVSVFMVAESPYNKGIPANHQRLMDYGDFGDTLTANVLDPAVADAGGEFREIPYEFSRNNSNPENQFVQWLGDIPNQRVEWHADRPASVNKKYA